MEAFMSMQVPRKNEPWRELCLNKMRQNVERSWEINNTNDLGKFGHQKWQFN